ncbi:MAG: hypothetical protein Tsb0016_06320 [Sphingomonadales bacterium]
MGRTAGWRATCAYAADRLLRRLGWGCVHDYLFLAQPVVAPHSPPPGKFASRALGPADPALDALPLTPEVRAYRFAQDAICVGAFDGDSLAAVLWYTTGPYEEDEVRARYLPLPARACAWDFGVYVMPRYRLSRAFAQLWAGAAASMRQHDIRWSLSRINSVNAASVAAHRRLGARTIGHATFLRLGALQIAISTQWPWLHCGLTDRARPLYRLHAPNDE